MANSAQEKLLETFTTILDSGRSDPEGTSGAADDLLSAITGAVWQNANSAAGANGSGSAVGSVVKTVLSSGLGLVPLIGGLIGLFGGGQPSAPEPLVKYELPPALNFEEIATATGLRTADYDQSGAPRAYGDEPTPPGETTTQGWGGSSFDSGGRPAQITVNVQAMDARSFLDRSSEIAAAVRNAMLNLNSINDVVNDL